MAKETTARTAAANTPVESANTAKEVANAASRDEQQLAAATAPVAPELRTSEGGKGAGPKSALKGGQGSEAELNADGSRKLRYSVQVHTKANGLEVLEPIDADSGDDAANKALASKGYKGVEIKGVQPYSDPDANSLGGERDAAIMISNASNNGHLINTLGTEANAEATAKLGKADLKGMF